MTISSQEPIETERLILRQLEPSDANQVFSFMSQASVMQYTSRAPLTKPHQASTFLAERTSGPNIYNFAVTLRTHNTSVIGILGSPNFPEIGYLFDPSYGGQGYATEALRAFVPRLFDVMPTAMTLDASETPVAGPVHGDPSLQAFDFAEAHVDVANRSSIALLERCGWSQGELMEAAYISPLLGVRDSVCYRIARPNCQLEDVFTAVQQEEEGQGFVPDLQ